MVAFILTKASENASDVALGTALGILLAIILGYVIFRTSVKLNIGFIFNVLGIVLIFVGAELFGEGLAKLIPSAAEILEEGGAVLFGGLSLLYFLKDDIKRLLKR